MADIRGSTNSSNVKENIKYLINSPDELQRISEQMFETADVNNTGYFTFDDVVTIFNVNTEYFNDFRNLWKNLGINLRQSLKLFLF